MRRLGALLAGATLLAAAGCGGAGSEGTGGSRSADEVRASQQAEAGSHDDVDVTFAQDMVPHHRQALEMVAIAKDKQGLDPDVADLVAQIEDAQGPEVARMTGWLQGWGEKVPSEGSDHMAMQGMLSGDELDQLRDTDGPAFQRLWLQSMVQHHQGAIPMAQREIAGGRSTAAIALAREIVRTQRAEIDQMTALVGQ